MKNFSQSDPVPAITEKDATGSTAEIFADIRGTLNVDVVNLIWRHLATMPGALEWVWASLKPLYFGSAVILAAHVRKNLMLPHVPPLSSDTLVAAGIDGAALSSIRAILDSYEHTNALALICFSAFLARFDQDAPNPGVVQPVGGENSYVPPARSALPRLVPIAAMSPPLVRLVHELNGFGEDSDPALVASMYRHLVHWPTYLALIRTLLVPLHQSGELNSLVGATRHLGSEFGARMVGAHLTWKSGRYSTRSGVLYSIPSPE